MAQISAPHNAVLRYRGPPGYVLGSQGVSSAASASPPYFVTHDQAEALAMSDKVVVMSQGRKEQEGDLRHGQEAVVVLRAEHILLTSQAVEEDDSTTLDGIVRAVDYQGMAARYFVESAGLNLQAINPIDSHPFRDGAEVKLRMRARDCVLLAPQP